MTDHKLLELMKLAKAMANAAYAVAGDDACEAYTDADTKEAAAEAALESALRVALAPPPGHVMVPVEPNDAMLNAANAAETKHVIQDRRQNGGNDPQLGWGAAYRAMIAAAQAGAQEPKP